MVKRHGDNAIALMHLVAAADEDFGAMEVHRTGQERVSAAETIITSTGFGTIRRSNNGLAF